MTETHAIAIMAAILYSQRSADTWPEAIEMAVGILQEVKKQGK